MSNWPSSYSLCSCFPWQISRMSVLHPSSPFFPHPARLLIARPKLSDLCLHHSTLQHSQQANHTALCSQLPNLFELLTQQPTTFTSVSTFHRNCCCLRHQWFLPMISTHDRDFSVDLLAQFGLVFKYSWHFLLVDTLLPGIPKHRFLLVFLLLLWQQFPSLHFCLLILHLPIKYWYYSKIYFRPFPVAPPWTACSKLVLFHGSSFHLYGNNFQIYIPGLSHVYQTYLTVLSIRHLLLDIISNLTSQDWTSSYPHQIKLNHVCVHIHMYTHTHTTPGYFFT